MNGHKTIAVSLREPKKVSFKGPDTVSLKEPNAVSLTEIRTASLEDQCGKRTQNGLVKRTYTPSLRGLRGLVKRSVSLRATPQKIKKIKISVSLLNAYIAIQYV